MGVVVELEAPGGERTWGVLVLATAGMPEWHGRVDDVPGVHAFCHGDVVAVDGGRTSARTPAPVAARRLITT